MDLACTFAACPIMLLRGRNDRLRRCLLQSSAPAWRCSVAVLLASNDMDSFEFFMVPPPATPPLFSFLLRWLRLSYSG